MKDPHFFIDRKDARFGVADSPEVCKLVADSIPLDVLKNARRILDVGSGCCGISRAIVKRMEEELYIDHYDAIFRVYGIDTDQALVNRARHLGFVQTVCADFLEWQPDMRFDFIVGNPPYGKNASLAVKFLNKAVELTDNISYVLPRTFRKPSILNRVHPELHLVGDEIVSDGMFGGTILTCYQKWERRSESRAKIPTVTTHPDFKFVTVDRANLFVGGVGAAAGSVKVEGFDHYNTRHYFLDATDTVRDRLIEIQDTLRQLARAATVGTPSLSKHELISTYVESFG